MLYAFYEPASLDWTLSFKEVRKKENGKRKKEKGEQVKSL